MKPENIERIIIEHQAYGRGKSHDEWWEVTVKYYKPVDVTYETRVYMHSIGEYMVSSVVTKTKKERFILNNIDEVLSFMQEHRLEFK